MSIDVAEDLLFSRLRALPPPPGGSAWPIQWPNDGGFQLPSPPSPWMRPQVMLERGLNVTSGARVVQDLRGVFAIELYDALGASARRIRERTKAIDAWFPHNLRLAAGSSSIRITGPVTPSGDGETDKVWYRRLVSIPIMVWLERTAPP